MGADLSLASGFPSLMPRGGTVRHPAWKERKAIETFIKRWELMPRFHPNYIKELVEALKRESEYPFPAEEVRGS